MIGRVQRRPGNVGQVVVVMPGVFVRRPTVIVCRYSMMLAFGGVANRKIGADPWERTKRRK